MVILPVELSIYTFNAGEDTKRLDIIEGVNRKAAWENADVTTTIFIIPEAALMPRI